LFTTLAIRAAGGLPVFRRNAKASCPQSLRTYSLAVDYLILDHQSRRNLEIAQTVKRWNLSWLSSLGQRQN